MPDFEKLLAHDLKIAVVGLGYVGLPLAVAFAKKFSTIGFDNNDARIRELKSGQDHTREVSSADLAGADMTLSSDPAILKEASVIIVAVPTPIDRHRNPDLHAVISASETVGANLTPGSIVVYESTVYPGLTEEVCVPILEKKSGLRLNQDFSVGYSPERINPGDKVHTLRTIKKIVSASNPEALELLTRLYGSVVDAGIHRASCIRVAEAAKVIENTQRDLNIALMNELAIIFERMGIDTKEVLDAAGSKWNFLPFSPGLVGGHCIGVDPYYLTFKAEELGFHPEVILAGRRINDRMGKYVAECAVKRLIATGHKVNGARIGILGLTFKENVPDLRNTKVVDIISELQDYGAVPLVADAEADADEARREYGLELVSMEEFSNLDALILAVGHKAYENLAGKDLRAFFANPDAGVVIDVKSFFDPDMIREAGLDYWRL